MKYHLIANLGEAESHKDGRQNNFNFTNINMSNLRMRDSEESLGKCM